MEKLTIGQIVLAPRSGKVGDPKFEAEVISLRNKEWPTLYFRHEIEGQDYMRKIHRCLIEPINAKSTGAAS